MEKAETVSAPEKAETASAPEKAETASAPEKAETASAPEKEETASAPEKEETASAPVIDEPLPINVQNYVKLHKLLNVVALPLLRNIFLDNWRKKYQRGWGNSFEQGTQFVELIGIAQFGEASRIQQKMLKTGVIETWDIPIMVDALKIFKIETKASQEQHKNFDKLNEVRDQICLHGGSNIDDKLFDEMWKTTSRALIGLGVKQKDLEKAKKVSLEPIEKNMKYAAILKSDGNLHAKNFDYELAAKKYSEAIKQPGLSAKELGVLHSNRSLAYLKMKNYYGAKDDAFCTTILRPNWWRGYGRLGYVYLSEAKYEPALANFNKAIELDPNCKLGNDRDHCHYMMEKHQRTEDVDPMYRTTSMAHVASKIKDRDGNIVFTPEMLAELSQQKTLKHLPTGMVAEGHKYLYGHGYKQNYEQAVHWFAKAAALGNAEGLYNLGILTKQGKGTPPDIAAGIRLIRLAASQNIAIDLLGTKIPNVGVVDAEHSLALSYMEGIGVPQDYKKAIQWYTRAIKHGSGVSANNVGKLYYDGTGVQQDTKIALIYYKLGASMQAVRPMENLVDVYLREYDLPNALKWFKYAVSKGSEYLQSKTDSMRHLVGVLMDTPLDEDAFEQELMNELSTGPLAHLIPVGLPPSPAELLQKLALSDPDVIIPSATSRSELGLADPYRKTIITNHRLELKLHRGEKLPWGEGLPKMLPKPQVDLFALKQIFLADMGLNRDEIFDGYAIKLTFIEDAILGRPQIPQVAEDEKGDAQRILIHNFPQNFDTQNKIGFGCKVTIINPHYRMANDKKPKIHVDDIKLMVLHAMPNEKKPCRYCGTHSATMVPCRSCRRTMYCTKLCLKKDAMELNHSSICFKHL